MNGGLRYLSYFVYNLGVGSVAMDKFDEMYRKMHEYLADAGAGQFYSITLITTVYE